MKRIITLFLGIIAVLSLFIALSCTGDNSTKPKQVSAPVFTPILGTYYRFLQVTIDCPTTGSVIHYTIDGSEPTESSPIYSTFIPVEEVTTIKARAFRKNDSPSEIVTAHYNILLPVVARPVFTPAPATYNYSRSVEITCETPDVQIYYTLDEQEPSQASVLYDSPIEITDHTILRAKAFKVNHFASQISEGEYFINYPSPINPSPEDNATNISSKPVLEWETLAKQNRNQTFDVYLSTSNNNLILVSEGQTEHSYEPAELTEGTTYYWQVLINDGEISSESSVWSFSTDIPLTANPEDDASGVTLNPTLTWELADKQTNLNRNFTYDVYLGTDSSAELLSEGQIELFYTPAELLEGTTYSWKVVVKTGELEVESPLWSFTTNHAPEIPSIVFPANNSTQVTRFPTLRWESTDERGSQNRNLSFDVYFGTSDNPQLVSENQTYHTYRPYNLSPSTVYYWKVTADDGEIEVTSPVWRFTTGN